MSARAPAEVYNTAWANGWTPDPELSICDWADKNVRLTTKSAAEAGPFRSSRTPYVREILDCLSPFSRVQRVVWIAGSQVAKTQSGLNWIGATIDQWPGPMLLVQPTVDVAKRVSKQRIAPLIENTPCLRAKVIDAKASRGNRDGNTMLEKEYRGGILIATGANSPAGLRSMPMRNLFLDEIDAYPHDVDDEGSAIDLAEARTSTFGARRKVFMTSTPTIKGASAIEREFEASDKRYYYVPCPHCGEFDTIRWSSLIWDENDPESVKLVCQHNGCIIEERHKTNMLANGQWRATATGNGTRGYHLNGLYAPLGWNPWPKLVRQFLNAKGNPEALKVFVNTILAETWQEDGEALEYGTLLNRLEDFQNLIPKGGKVLTAAVDVQSNRLEVQVKAYGVGEESWVITHVQLMGDPGTDQVWFDLNDFLNTRFKHADGHEMTIARTLIDSGGHHTDHVYKFVHGKKNRGIFACKGLSTDGKEIVGRPSFNNARRVPLYLLGVNAAKDKIMSRLKQETAGPGYIHLPDWVDEEYVRQLTAESAIRKYVKGRGTVRVWIKNNHERNEVFDLTVYCLAALYTLPLFQRKKLLGDAPPDGAVGDVQAGDETESAPETSAQSVASAALEQRKQMAENLKRGRHVPRNGATWATGWK